jgi:hypothetical protein
MREITAGEADRHQMDLLLRGFQVSRMLRLVADLGIADKIPADQGVPVQDLATSCAVLTQPLLRVLRALAALKSLRSPRATSHTPVAHGCCVRTPRTVCITRLASGLDPALGRPGACWTLQ